MTTQLDSPTPQVHANGRPLRYPDGLNELPQLLEELQHVEVELEGVFEQIYNLLATVNRLIQFSDVKVEKARIRERRRTRRRSTPTRAEFETLTAFESTIAAITNGGAQR